MSNQNYDYFLKVLLIGESGVGKTSILLRFADDYFPLVHQSTVGVDFKQKMINYKDKVVKMQIWDTAGQERFRTITKSYYKKANGIIMVYDVSDENSFFNVKNWLKQVDALADPSICKILIGNKSDVDPENRKVDLVEGEKLAKELKIPFFESSAKDNLNITKIFMEITKLIADKLEKTNINSDQIPEGRISIQKEDYYSEKSTEGKVNCYC